MQQNTNQYFNKSKLLVLLEVLGQMFCRLQGSMRDQREVLLTKQKKKEPPV